jgi:hypothetical protein
MSQSETDKIKAAIGEYRQFKFKFVQFVKNFEEFLSETKNQRIINPLTFTLKRI